MLMINYINRNMSRFILNSGRKFLLKTNINSQKVAKCKFNHLSVYVLNVSSRNNCTFKALKHSEVIGTLYVRHQSTVNIPKETVLNSQIDPPATQILKTVENTSDTVKEGFISELPEIPVPEIQEVAETIVKLHPNGEVTLQSIGLGGNSPSGIMQSTLEWLHISFHLPWWLTIVLSTMCLKFLLFPVAVLSMKYNTNWANHMPQIFDYQSKIQEARQCGDTIKVNYYVRDMSKFIKEKKISPINTMIPLMMQTPVFISMFWALKSMSNAPVESFKNGGLWWFTDLTTFDPYYILPVLTSSTIYLMLRYGSLSTVNQNIPPLMKYCRNIIPVVVFLFTMNFSSAMLCYWTTSNFLSMIQVMTLSTPRVRKLCNIPERVIFKDPRASKGFVKELQNSWTNMKEANKVSRSVYADEIIFNNAGKGPLKRTYKYDPTKAPPTSAQILAKKK